MKAVRKGHEVFAEIQVNRPGLIVTDIAMPVLSGLDLNLAVWSNWGESLGSGDSA